MGYPWPVIRLTSVGRSPSSAAWRIGSM